MDDLPLCTYSYAPWCGHCRKLEPTWEALATQTKGRLNVGKVDATKNEGSIFNPSFSKIEPPAQNSQRSMTSVAILQSSSTPAENFYSS